jgi:hypothetical protein
VIDRISLKLVFDQGSNRVSTDGRNQRGLSTEKTERDGRICRRAAHENFLTPRNCFLIHERELIDGVDEINRR